MREGTRSKGAFVVLVIFVVFALIVGTFGDMLEFYRPAPDIPYWPSFLFSAG